jgi:hypothetical protein
MSDANPGFRLRLNPGYETSDGATRIPGFACGSTQATNYETLCDPPPNSLLKSEMLWSRQPVLGVL